MATRVPTSRKRIESASSDDSGFGDDGGLTHEEFIRRKLEQMNALMDASPAPTVGPPAGSLLASLDGLSTYEKLKALSLSESTSTSVSGPEEPRFIELRDSFLPPPHWATMDPVPQDDDFDEYGKSAIHNVCDDLGNSQYTDLDDDDDAVYDDAAAKQEEVMALKDEVKNSAVNDDEDDDEDDDDDDTYEITWTTGQLGLLFTTGANGSTVIRRVNKKGHATGLQYARVGDALVAINSSSVAGRTYHTIMDQLKDPQPPVTLTFQPVKVLPDASEPVIEAPVPVVVRPASPKPKPVAHDPWSMAEQMPIQPIETDYFPPQYYANDRRRGSSNASVEEYDVIWDEGPLGCGLKQRDGLPTVKSVSGTGLSPSVAQIQAGDILAVVNGMRSEDIGFRGAVAMLQRAAKPVYLRFRRPRVTASAGSGTSEAQSQGQSTQSTPAAPIAVAPRQYSVVWEDGPLGIQIRLKSNGNVVVSRLTGASTNPYLAEQIAVGDVFIAVGGVEVATLGITGAFEMLKTVAKPVTLVFEKPGRSPSSNASFESTVPSFRQMREEQANMGSPTSSTTSSVAAAAAAANGPAGLYRVQSAGVPSFARNRPQLSRGYSADVAARRVGGAENPRRFGYEDRQHSPPPLCNDDNISDVGSQESRCLTETSEHARVDPDQDSLRNYGGPPAPPPTSFASAMMFGMDNHEPVSTRGMGLVPPPAYTDVFASPGRAAGHSPTANSEDMSVSSADPCNYDRYPMPPPPTYRNGGIPPPPPYANIAETNASTRLFELRQQYIESERRRNAGTTFSSYSDLDDSGMMKPQPGSRDFGVSPAAGLPSLWVRWSDGPLGITFKRKNGQIIVSRLTGAGYSPGLSQLQSGDWLVSFGNYSTLELRLSETMALLKRLPKPVDMCFVVQ